MLCGHRGSSASTSGVEEGPGTRPQLQGGPLPALSGLCAPEQEGGRPAAPASLRKTHPAGSRRRARESGKVRPETNRIKNHSVKEPRKHSEGLYAFSSANVATEIRDASVAKTKTAQ